MPTSVPCSRLRLHVAALIALLAAPRALAQTPPGVAPAPQGVAAAEAPSAERVAGVDPSIVASLRALGLPYIWSKQFSLERVKVVNMIPNAQSDETGQDSEPNLAVDPSNPSRVVGSAFTSNPTGATDSAPVYVSTDGGTTWAMSNIVPSGNGWTSDISIDFAGQDHTLYAGILRGGSSFRQMVLRAPDPFTGTMMRVLTDHSTESLDQPYVSAATTTVGGANQDRVYVGFNEYDNRTSAGGTGRTASGEYSLDARTAAPPAGFTTARLEVRGTAEQDMPAVRFAVHPSGVLYGVFYRWASGSVPSAVCDVVVVRDDTFASGATPFAALTDPSDGLAGRIVVAGRTVPAFPARLGQNRLVASNLSIAVDPSNAATVWVAWADRVGANDYTLHVRRSIDSGATWSADLLTITNATNPALAVSSEGVLGFAYQALTGTAPNQRWETHLQRTKNGTTWSDLVLANTPNADPPLGTFEPYLGDYIDLIAVGRSFFGVFSASNIPDRANFPHGARFQRNADFTNHVLRNVANTANVATSIDPFFFSVSTSRVFDLCRIAPLACRPIKLVPGRILIGDGAIPVRVVDPIPNNCKVKWPCPGCGGGALCPPYYHMFLEDLDPREWRVGLVDGLGETVRHEVHRFGGGVVVSFRPSRQLFREGSIGDYALVLESVGTSAPSKLEIQTHLETSDFPFPEHVKRGPRTALPERR